MTKAKEHLTQLKIRTEIVSKDLLQNALDAEKRVMSSETAVRVSTLKSLYGMIGKNSTSLKSGLTSQNMETYRV